MQARPVRERGQVARAEVQRAESLTQRNFQAVRRGPMRGGGAAAAAAGRRRAMAHAAAVALLALAGRDRRRAGREGRIYSAADRGGEGEEEEPSG